MTALLYPNFLERLTMSTKYKVSSKIRTPINDLKVDQKATTYTSNKFDVIHLIYLK